MRLIYHDYIIIFSPNSIFSLCYFPLLFLSLSLSLSSSTSGFDLFIFVTQKKQQLIETVLNGHPS